MKMLNRRYAVALVLVALGLVSCSTPGGPFVTVTIIGIPTQATKLVMTAKLGANERPAETQPAGAETLPLTIDLPIGSRGELAVSAEALVAGTACTLFKGAATVDLKEDAAYAVTLPLTNMTLTNCNGVPTVSLTVLKVESAGSGSGSVVSDVGGISCSTGCTSQTATYLPNAPIALTAMPAVGTQVKWSEPSCDTNLVCSFKLAQSKTVTATFTACKGAWCNEGSPAVATDLYGVWGIAGGSVYAVGDGGRILVRNNAQWAPMTSGVTVPLRAIGAEKGNKSPYVGGDSGTFLSLSGTTWSNVALPAIATKQIVSITGEYTNGFGGLGAKTTSYLCTSDGVLYLKENSGTWAAVADTVVAGHVLHGISSANGNGAHESTVVGEGGFVVRRLDSLGKLTSYDHTPGSQTTMALRGVWTGGAQTVAVGDNGVIITHGTQDYGNATKVWTQIPLPPTMPKTRLMAVWGGDDQNIWIVGDGGVILKYDGNATVTKQENVPNVDLTGVWAADADPTHVYAVGRNGTILHYVKP